MVWSHCRVDFRLLRAGIDHHLGQAHVADIDSTNTLAAALTALCGIEVFIASPWHGYPARVGGADDERRSDIENTSAHHASNTGRMPVPRGWVLITGAALAATLLTKGPGGLPIIIGVWLWGLFAAGRGKRIRLLASPRFWLPWAVALGIFGVWIFVAWHGLHVRDLPIDWKGVSEGASQSHARSLLGVAKSLMVLPVQLLLFALPVSLALPLYFHPEIRGEKISRALVWSVLLSWGVCVLAAMDNPRYAYPTLIPLCPLAGAVAVAASKGNRVRELLGIFASASAILFVAGSVVLTKMGWATPWGKPFLMGVLVVEVVIAGWTIAWLRSSWRGAWGLAALAVLTIVPFSVHEQLVRIATSGVSVTPVIERIVGNNGVVAVGGAVTSKPETFYYAHVQLHFYKPIFTPKVVEPGSWVILDQAEHKAWLAVPGVRLEQDQFLCKWGRTDYFIAWYARR